MSEPAFPFAWESPLTGKTTINNGMTLRDYFAAKAMVGVMTDLKEQWHWAEEYGIEKMIEFTAQRAYEQADAMMKAREA
jgi:hypothetical protein